MSDVERLPVQHPRAPHCPNCKADLPTFDGMQMIMPNGDWVGFKLLSVVLNVECACGSRWALKKEIA